MKKILFASLFLLATAVAGNQDLHAQEAGNLRRKVLIPDTLVFKIDTLSIIPYSLHVIQGLSSGQFEIDYATATITLADSSILGRSVSLVYRVLPFDLSAIHRHKSTDIILENTSLPRSRSVPISTFTDFLREEASFVSAGSLARGFSMGNNQDVVLNSSLNLQLSGMLSEELEVSANITDRNLPLQPEGNSVMIQDFDRIFIHLNYKKQYFLDAGDIDVNGQKSYFLRMNKRLLGMDLRASHPIRGENTLRNQVGGGVNKGKFIRQTLPVINGVQGPYKLHGENNELNIIILSGSERVYLDGRLLTRGADQDYTMDYNTGEITFTSRILVATEKRFTVELQYRSDYFSHYTLFTSHEFTRGKNDKLTFGINFYHDQDQKNRSIQPELNNEQKSFLSKLGDNFSQAFFPMVDSMAYNSHEILYKRVDTVVGGILYDSVYLHSTRPEDKLYRLSFSWVGEGRGNYILVNGTTNGRVFRWVAPLNGIPQGSYEPVLLLSTPKLVQMGTLSAAYRFKKDSWIKGEWAISHYDQNTFSSLDDQDNTGMAMKIAFFDRSKIFRKRSEDWRWENSVNYEFLSRNFHAEESFRDVEFARNFNLAEDYTDLYAEHLLRINSTLQKLERGSASYALDFFSRPGNTELFKNHLDYDFKKKGFSLAGTNSFLTGKDSLQNKRFFQTRQQLSHLFKSVEIGATELAEINLIRQATGDSLLGNSYAFAESAVFLKNNDTLPYLFNLRYMNRLEYDPGGEQLILQNIHHEVSGSFHLNLWKNHRIQGNLTFRNSQFADSSRKTNRENFLTGSLEYYGRFLKNSLVLSTFYEMGSGLEQKRIFSFLRVADGQGTHTWNDYNRNGLEELDEFDVAAFQDQANYVKIWINTPEYITTSNTRFTQTLQWIPRNLWGGKKGVLKFISCFGNTSSLQTSQKNTLGHHLPAYNPFRLNIDDSALVSNNLNFFNNLSFNQTGRYWGIEYLAKITQDKRLLYYGIEQNRLNSQEVVARITPHQKVLARLNYHHGVKKNHSAYLANREYQILQNHLKGFLQYSHNHALYASISYTYKVKENVIGIEKLYQHQVELQANYRMANKANFSATVQWNLLEFNTDENSSLSYEMLEGLQNGQNLIWTLGIQSSITDFLQVELSYTGRAAEGSKSVHVGNIQLRAYF